MASSLGPYWPLSYRGKCSVTLLNETDILSQYLEKEVSRVLGGEGGGTRDSDSRGLGRGGGPRPSRALLLTSSCLPQDCFFYSLVFDPVQKTLLADQGEIRVGCKYQAEIPERLVEGEWRDRLSGH